ncbi:hypothetical protein FH972_021290 [Carpinus fangiana]|uniref:Protein-serine/threonine kinase n=1 Tax=Carpinus fangiana TaxID=176857 RepID=A0A5N6KPB2_9ROSI|nr:hypothetical protein FH972_021290 [Carpinus fangiana]
MHSLSTLLPYSERTIGTPEDEESFTHIMAALVRTHSNTIPVLARGFLESRKYISPTAVTEFLDEHLRARIGTRLIAEQHIALHNSTLDAGPESEQSSYIGIIDTALRPASIVRSCESFVSDICELSYGVRPTVTLDGEPDTAIAHVPVHLEYVITELLKNAFRATIENGKEREPVEVTIAPAPDTVAGSGVEAVGASRSSVSDVKLPAEATPGVTIRIRDRGGGIAPDDFQKLWTYGFTTFNDREASDASSSGSGSDALNIISGSAGGGSTLAGLGYGLPLGRAYAEYFGGGIAVQSLHGWGTDVYLTLRGVCRTD